MKFCKVKIGANFIWSSTLYRKIANNAASSDACTSYFSNSIEVTTLNNKCETCQLKHKKLVTKAVDEIIRLKQILVKNKIKF